METDILILEQLSKQEKMGFNQLREILDISAALLSRHLKKLIELNCAVQTSDKKYGLGSRIQALAGDFDSVKKKLQELLPPVLENIETRFQCTVICFYVSNNVFECIDKRISENGFVMQNIGVKETNYLVNPRGYLLLANKSSKERRFLIENEIEMHREKVPDKKFFERCMKQAQEEGYCDDEGIGFSPRRIGYPIYKDDRMVASLEVGFSKFIQDEQYIEDLKHTLLKKSMQMSEILKEI